jgi:hypothetical protein
MSETPGVYNVGDNSPFKQKSAAEMTRRIRDAQTLWETL